MPLKSLESSGFAFRAPITKKSITSRSELRLAQFSRLHKLEVNIYLTNPDLVQEEGINHSDFTGISARKIFSITTA